VDQPSAEAEGSIALLAHPSPPFPVKLEQAAAIARYTLVAEGQPALELSITLVDDERIAAMHVEYLDVEGPTDVISFPLRDEGDPDPLLGEVVVSLDTALRQSADHDLDPWKEALLYVVHGSLHLLGYDDHEPDDEARMAKRQRALLDAFLAGAEPPSPD